MKLSRAAGLAIVVAVAACSTTLPSPESPTPSPSARPKTYALGAAPPWRGCAGIGLRSVLHGDPTDPHVVWLEPVDAHFDRLEVLFPPGYTARFTPDLVVFGPDGDVVGREGSLVDGYCIIEAAGVPRNVVRIRATDIAYTGVLAHFNTCFIMYANGETLELRWPAGFRTDLARNGMRLLDRAGHVIARDGDTVAVTGRVEEGGTYCMLGRQLHVSSIVDVHEPERGLP